MTPPRGSIDVLLSNFAFKVGLRVFGGNTVATSNLNEIAELGKEPVRRAQLDDETREYINLDCGCFSPKPRPWKRPPKVEKDLSPGGNPVSFPSSLNCTSLKASSPIPASHSPSNASALPVP